MKRVLLAVLAFAPAGNPRDTVPEQSTVDLTGTTTYTFPARSYTSFRIGQGDRAHLPG
ncbi:hypothetical protein [Lentzea sp. NPDC059081]|uniref:hypothetical protein n=1 Tax=Lentzea sp. NPDC059081 TaxID=3346719 RepID=UPI0036BF70F3